MHLVHHPRLRLFLGLFGPLCFALLVGLGACGGDDGQQAVFQGGSERDSGAKAGEKDASKDPPPRPIDEKPKPEDPDKAPVPEVTSVTPAKATLNAIGPSIVVKGKSFVPRSLILVNGEKLQTSFTSATELAATLPTAKLTAIATLKITVSTAEPGGGTSNAIDFAVENPKPELNGVLPLNVVANSPATTITLTGTSFAPTAKVSFGVTDLPTTFKSPTELSAVIPANLLQSSKSVPVHVTNPAPGGGLSTDIAFAITIPNAGVTAINPTTKPINSLSFLITVNGSGYVDGTKILFNGLPLATTVVAPDELTATVPATSLTAAGDFAVTVQNPGGGIVMGKTFQVTYPIPVVNSIAPTTVGAGSGPTEITVTGTKFFPVSSVTFDGAAAPSTFVDNTKVKASLTAAQIMNAGVIQVRVINPTPGGGTSVATTTVTVTNGVPTVNTLMPAAVAPGSPDTALTILGAGFVSTSTVKIAGNAAASTYVDGSKITTTVPAAALTNPGTTVPIIVTNPPPGGGSSAAFNLVVQCDSTGVNVLVNDTTTTQTLTLDLATATPVSRWPANGGTCPVDVVTGLDQPAKYAIVQNTTLSPLTISSWAVCTADPGTDGFLAYYKRATAPTTDEERKACTGVVSEGGATYKSPESGTSTKCPGLTKANGGGLQLGACERAILQVQAFKFDDPATPPPPALKVKGD